MKETKKSKGKANSIQGILVGGLGNQLFGYFAGLYLSRDLSVDFIPRVAKKRIGETQHAFGIESFDLPYPARGGSELSFRTSLTYRRVKRKLLILLGFSHHEAEQHSKLHSAIQIGSDPDILSTKGGSVIEGYFQTYRYFSSIKNEFPQGLSLRRRSSWLEEKSLEMISLNPIVMHVRRGDYVNPKNRKIGVLSPEFFRSALKKIMTSDPNPFRPVWVFSDDLEKVKDEFEFLENMDTHFVRVPDNSDPAESLILMSQASSIVISNSTFSWWSATVSSDAQVVAPSKWFKEMDDPEDLIPNHWIRVESQWIPN
jgi:hypothetical protein